MLPAGFTEKMERLPGLDVVAFFRALDGEAVRGLRINPAKCDALPAPSPFILRRITYVRGGYILESCDVPVGQTPEHHAGMIYMQDPGAMCPVAAVNIEEGWRVADLCAAPGGKTSQLSAAVGEGGAVLSNEYVGKRARILVGNVERLGLRNVAVTSLDTSELAKMYPAFFDLVAADAPCSGEGMFRKCEDAVSDWSENNVRECAKRQAVILDAAAKMVKPGGLLLYSTCTYSPEEDEMTVSAFTERYPEFSIIPVREEIRRVTAPGIRLPGVTTKNIEECRRFYPYLTPGEGQFLCLMRKNGGEDEKTAVIKDTSPSPMGDTARAADAFIRENFVHGVTLPVRAAGDILFIPPSGLPLPGKGLMSRGVIIGEYRSGVLRPHHQLFSAYGSLMRRREELPPGDPRIKQYLHGEEIESADTGDDGYIAVCYSGAVIGGGKRVGNRIKNYYPKGLRE